MAMALDAIKLDSFRELPT